jgi:hypothetical protein
VITELSLDVLAVLHRVLKQTAHVFGKPRVGVLEHREEIKRSELVDRRGDRSTGS